MKLTFLETPVFTQQIKHLLHDDDYRNLQARLLISPTAGDVMIGTSGCRKIRWRSSQRQGGKRGGIRVIYFFRRSSAQILFLLAYDHRLVDDLNQSQRKQLAEVVKLLK